MVSTPLSTDERLFYRDRLRAARYSALADAEGFSEICFAIEALGMRLKGKKATINKYRTELIDLANTVPIKDALAQQYPGCFSQINALYSTLHEARNDAMHTGAYARHATASAIELCIHLEEALMTPLPKPGKVSDYMVRSVVHVEAWHPVAHARQRMLTHSFSFLPVNIGQQWKLVSELAVAKFLPNSLADEQRKLRLAMPIEQARGDGLELLPAEIAKVDDDIDTLLTSAKPGSTPTLWLVVGEHSPNGQKAAPLLGVLTPFELM